MAPQARRSLSAAWLKAFACLFMVVDHVDSLFHVFGGVAAPDSLLYSLPRFLGRLSLPVFVFLLVEGCRKTHDFSAYLKRLLLFALISQIPYTLAFGKWGGNIILTFFLGALGIFCYERLGEGAAFAVRCLPAAGLAALGVLLDTDYGWIGVALPLLLYLCGEGRGRQLLGLGVGLFTLYFLCNLWSDWSPALYALLQGSTVEEVLARSAAYLPYWLSFAFPFAILCTLFASAALIPLYFYSGERGRGSKWFFYWFYPAHLLALWLLRVLIPA